MAKSSGKIGAVGFALALLAVGLAGGCKLASESCVPGESVACVGAGGCAGSQVCNAAGSAFGACACGAAPACSSTSGGTTGSSSSGSSGAVPSVCSGTFSGSYAPDGIGACQAVSGTISNAEALFILSGSDSTLTLTADPASAGGGAGGAGLTTVTSPAGLSATLNVAFCLVGAPAAGTYTQAATSSAAGQIDIALLSLAGGDGFEAASPGSGACAGTGGATEGSYTLTVTSVTPYGGGDTMEGTLTATSSDAPQGGPGCTLTLQLSCAASSTGSSSSGGASSGGSGSSGGSAGMWNVTKWNQSSWN